MIDVADSNSVYYYHFDGLGSVVALSDSNGDTVQTYEYSIYGQVAVEYPNFLTNPYMFTGRRFDIETGLYYYRARYYNPHIGRFMQTDPVGYGAGMNLYTYCGNNSLNYVDPSGLAQVVTGKYWVLPFGHDPDDVVIDIVTGLRIGIGITVSLISTPLGVVATVTEDCAEDVGVASDSQWRAFIEVRDCNDLNSNGIIEEREKTGDPYWIEVTNIGSGGESTDQPYDQTAGWDPDGCAYLYVTDAQDAAGTAVAWAFYVYHGKRPFAVGVIPEDLSSIEQYFFDVNVDPYGNVPYGVDEDEDE